MAAIGSDSNLRWYTEQGSNGTCVSLIFALPYIFVCEWELFFRSNKIRCFMWNTLQAEVKQVQFTVESMWKDYSRYGAQFSRNKI